MKQIAKIIRSDNTDGGILVGSDYALEEFTPQDPLYIVFDGLETPFFIQSVEQRGNKYILHLNDVCTLQDSEELVGREIFADIEYDDEPEQDFTGWTVFDNGKRLGEVTGDEPIPGNYCIYVELAPGLREESGDEESKRGAEAKSGDAESKRGAKAKSGAEQGCEVMIPLHEDFIISADPEKRELFLTLPEGLY